MELTPAEKAAFAVELKIKVNEAHDRETKGLQPVLSYLGVCRMTTMIEQEFVAKVGVSPKLIRGACQLARALRNPDEIKAKAELRKGLGLVVTAAGGFSIVWGILSAFNILTVLGVVLAIHTPFIGPAIFIAGLALVVGGIYAALTKQTPEALSAKAHDLLIEAISNWADDNAAADRDATAKNELVRKLPEVENKVSMGAVIGSIFTWPFRTVADFIDGRPTSGEAKADIPAKTPKDEG